MKYNLDLHTYLLKRRSPSKRYWKYVDKNNLLGTAITEHNNLNPKGAYFELLKNKPKNKVLIPGVSINTDSGGVIILSKSPEIYDYGIIYEQNIGLKRIYDFCEKKGYLIAFSHPFGFAPNSATYKMGLDKLEKFVSCKNIGIETYNGMIGYLSYYLYDSFFIRRIRELLSNLEKNSLSKTIKIAKIFEKYRLILDHKSYDVVYRFSAGIKLGKLAKFVIAGSGTEFIERIGSGVLSIDLPKNFFETYVDLEAQNEYILNKIYNKDILSVGPPGKDTDVGFERSTRRINKTKAYTDLVYLTKNSVKWKYDTIISISNVFFNLFMSWVLCLSRLQV